MEAAGEDPSVVPLTEKEVKLVESRKRIIDGAPKEQNRLMAEFVRKGPHSALNCVFRKRNELSNRDASTKFLLKHPFVMVDTQFLSRLFEKASKSRLDILDLMGCFLMTEDALKTFNFGHPHVYCAECGIRFSMHQHNYETRNLPGTAGISIHKTTCRRCMMNAFGGPANRQKRPRDETNGSDGKSPKNPRTDGEETGSETESEEEEEKSGSDGEV